jgi:hypothetical protein
MMSKVKRHILKRILTLLALFHQGGDCVAEEALVLTLCVVFFTRDFEDVGGGIVAGTGELNQFGDLDLREIVRGGGEVGRGELDDDFVGGGVRFAEVGCVAETEGCGRSRGCEGLCEICGKLVTPFGPYRSRGVRVSERTAQKRQLPSNQPSILPQLPMLLQLPMSMTRQIISIVVLIRPHFLLALGPET